MRHNVFSLFPRGMAITLGLIAPLSATHAEPLARNGQPAGAVIDRKTGEEVRFVDLSDWKTVELKQNLLGGDVLRTNAVGQLSILFADRTQVRLGRNSALQVKQMGTAEDTVLNLQAGSMWARAERGGQALTVETPAAAAAIRGTDWSLTVKGKETSLIVLEGEIEFKNAFGSVSVKAGEGAVASIGQAPRKLVIVNTKDRQQMLFYMTLRSGFTYIPASPLAGPRMRAEKARIEEMPADRRSTADWLTLVETRTVLDTPAQAAAALEALRGRTLSRSEKARLLMIEALDAGSEGRFAEAAELFRRAAPGLDAERRAMAAYGGYFARSLADPNRVEQPPVTASTPQAEIMKAVTQGFLKDIPAAIDVLRAAERRHPGDARIPATLALLYGLDGDRQDMQAAIDRALAIDPDDPQALFARGTLKADYLSDNKGAIADFEHAIRMAPGDSSSWNSLGLVLADRGATREAETTLKKAIELDPNDPVGYTNLAIHYLDQSRVKEAKALIDKALSVDPGFSVALVARGRYHLQTGDIDRGIEDLLAGSTANPGYSQAQILLAAGHYMKGEPDPAEQAIDNADRLDGNDPVVPSVRTSIAIENYDAEEAIRSAQELMRRSRAQGGDFAQVGANQDAGSTLNNAFRLQGLDAWGRYYGDITFDPFAGAGYIDQAVRGQANPYANAYIFGETTAANTDSTDGFSSQLQGLMLDPHMLAGRSRRASLLREPFIDLSFGAGLSQSGGRSRRLGELEVQGFTNEPLPTSVLANVTWTALPASGDYQDFGDFTVDTDILDANGYLTTSLTENDRIVLFGNHTRSDFDASALGVGTDLGIPLPQFRLRNDENTVTNLGLGWSHTFAYRNVLNAALLYNRTDQTSGKRYIYDLPAPFDSDDLFVQSGSQKTTVAAVNHSIGTDDVTLRYGLEGGVVDSESDFSANGIPLLNETARNRIALGYVDVLQDVSADLTFEYGLFGSLNRGESDSVYRIDPRFGAAWAPTDRHWLRAAFMRHSVDVSTPTLAPIGVLGIQPNRFGLENGYVDTTAFQWDAEWTDRFFTSLEYQHQNLTGFSIGYPTTSLPSSDTLSFSEGSIDRASFTTNTVLGGGFGLSTTLALARSEDRDPSSATFEGSLPFVPKTAGQVALTWVNEANVKATLAANYVGERTGDDQGTVLDDYWTLDASLTFEPFDRHIAFEASAYNLLNEEFELTPGVPGWGPSFKGMMKVRF